VAEYMLLDNHYHVVAHVPARHGYIADLHEFQVMPDGTAYLGAYHAVQDPVTGLPTLEYVVQRVDIASGHVRFEWHSLDHVPTADTYKPRPASTSVRWDYFHGNAIEPIADGDLLVSARNTSTIYRISGRTGEVLWRMGGKRDDFGLVSRHPEWQFCYQHDVRVDGADRLSLFDNGGGSSQACPRHRARVEVFAYDTARMTVARVKVLSSRAASPSGDGFFTRMVGSARRLANDNWMVSWGDTGHVTEFGPGGRPLFDLTLSTITYRAVRWRWTGDPVSRPSIAVDRGSGTVTAWASWNGATEVSRWRLVAGPSADRLQPVGPTFARHGFETRLQVATWDTYVAVTALDASGRVLAT
jgi:hypothetical protein